MITNQNSEEPVQDQTSAIPSAFNPEQRLVRIQESRYSVVAANIICALDAANIWPKPGQSHSLPDAALDIIQPLLATYDLSAIEFNMSDLVSMFDSEVGNMLRKPVLYGITLSIARKSNPETDEQQHIIDLISEYCSLQTTSSFEADRSDSFAWTEFFDRFHNACAKDLLFAEKLLRDISNYFQPYLEQCSTYLRAHIFQTVANVPHAVSPMEVAAQLLVYINSGHHNKDVAFHEPLVRPVKCMYVEDNPAALYGHMLDNTQYLPWQKSGYIDGRGHFNGRRYLLLKNVIDDLDQNEQLPELVLTDIELGNNSYGGLQIVDQLNELAYVRKIPRPYIVVYSRAIDQYKEHLDAMKEQDKIDGYFSKQEFTVGSFTEFVNSLLNRE